MAVVSIDLVARSAFAFGDTTSAGGLAAAFNGTTSTVAVSCAAKQIATGTDCYCGTILASTKRISNFLVFGASDQGFSAVGNPSVTITAYGKSGSNPANSTDGTQIGTITFTDTANESSGRTINVVDTNTYDRIWLRGTRVDATPRNFLFAEIQASEVAVVGDLVVSETGSDTATFTGTVTSSAISGDLAATETGSDTAALSGSIAVSGSLAVTEVGADVAAFTGSVPISAALAATESGVDTGAFSGTVAVSGSLAATEIGTDTASFTGTLGALSIIAIMAAQETGADTAAFSGNAVATANLAATETGTDTAALSGKVTITGNVAATETGSDTAAFTGKVLTVADFAASEIGVDLAAFSGSIKVAGSLAGIETGVDTASFDAGVAATGTLNAFEVGDDTAAFQGNVASRQADFNAFEEGQDTAVMFLTAVDTPPKPDYLLLSNASTTGGWVPVAGGGYVWTMVAQNFNSATAILQAKGADGATAMKVAELTRKGMLPVNIGDNTEMRVRIAGQIIGGFSDLRAFDSRDYTTQPPEHIPTGCESATKVPFGTLCTIRPSNTDPRLIDSGDTAHGFGFHVIGLPDHPTQDHLWLHFTGTGGTPYVESTNRYLNETWIGELMEQGFTVLDIAYDSEISITEICKTPLAQATDNAAGDLRRQIITGEDVSILYHPTEVPPINCINNRIEFLLNYMEKNDLPLPRYALPFNYANYHLSGHSQGSGHAYYIGKYYGSRFTCCLGGPYDLPDDVPVPRPPQDMIADWYMDEATNMTPVSNIGAFATTADPYYGPFTGAYGKIGLTKGEEWFNVTKKFYINKYGKKIDGHAAAVGDPSLKPYRASACFRNL